MGHQPDMLDQRDGIINLLKPVGASSAQYVYKLRPIFGVRRVGHAGSLDPFAEGVLIGCVGRATKLVERLMGLPKRYAVTLRLGVTNQTFDTEQPFEPVAGAAPVSRRQVEEAAAEFIGCIPQVPPSFSAIRVNGRFSYHLAKEGKAVELAARNVHIHRLHLEEYEWPTLKLAILCGRGTYVRAIARDLGRRLACGAVCERLIREAVGPFEIESSVELRSCPPETVRAALLPIDAAVALLDRWSAYDATSARAEPSTASEDS